MNDFYSELSAVDAVLSAFVNKFVKNRPDESTAAALANRYQLASQFINTIGETMEVINNIASALKTSEIPSAFEREGITTVTLDSGYRVTVSQLTRASIIDKEAAFEWLKDNGHEYAIQSTVNSSTLSSLAKTMLEEGKELPDDKFKVVIMPNTSITKVQKRAKN